MEDRTLNTQEDPTKTEVVTRMLGAHVPESLYWEFKRAAASRSEQLKEAIEHAARMYIDAGAKEGK